MTVLPCASTGSYALSFQGPSRPAAPNRTRRAATAVEFAIVASVFFTFVLGFIEVGRGFMIQHLMTNAARQGCRVPVIDGKTNTDVNNTVYAVVNAEGINGDSVTVQVNDVTANDSMAKAGVEVSVIVSISASSVSWVPGSQYLFGTITGKYTLRRE
jgi:Flp pilus assembly protein TadG